jgi:hypothetical protein
MSNVNVQVSLTNLTQMDRHQSDTHRSPMVNQEQNAEHSLMLATRRLLAPVEPDKVEGKKIDPKARREEEARKRRKREQQSGGESDAQRAMKRVINSSGRGVDFEA